MGFDEQTLAEIVRVRLQLASTLDVLWAIPESLQRLSGKLAADKRMRHLIMTDDTQKYSLSPEGAVDLAAVETALGKWLEAGEIWYENPDSERYQYPMQPLRNPAYINSPKGNDYYHYYLVGNELRTRNLDRNQPDVLEGNLYFHVPRMMVLADADTHAELQELIIEKVIETITAPKLDAAEDGEN